MNTILLIPVILSAFLMAAHFYLLGSIGLVCVCLAVPVLLRIKRGWVVRCIQIFLIIGSIEWIRTMMAAVALRKATGMPWVFILLCLGPLALFTALSALVFSSPPIRNLYFRR